jgi:hypothetical protein
VTLEQFAECFFARKPVPDRLQFDCFMQDLSGQQFDEALPCSPAVLVEHTTLLCTESEVSQPGIRLLNSIKVSGAFLGENLRLYEFLWDSSIPLQ